MQRTRRDTSDRRCPSTHSSRWNSTVQYRPTPRPATTTAHLLRVLIIFLTEFYRFLPRFTYFYRVLPGFTEFLPRFTEFFSEIDEFYGDFLVYNYLYLVLPSFTEFYRVLPSFLNQHAIV